jgi:hypothetical protein
MPWDGADATLSELLASVAEAGAPVSVRAARPPSREALASLAAAGVAGLVLALHGARREVHDWHAGAGAFDAALAALTAARSHGIEATVVTDLSRSNARVLGELPPLLRARGVRRWELRWPDASAPGDERWTARVPRLGLGVPAALAALDRARRMGLEAWLRGVPLCAAGPFASRVLPSAPRAYGTRCEGCAARARCAGVDATYLARFGEGELRTLSETPDAPPAASDEALPEADR